MKYFFYYLGIGFLNYKLFMIFLVEIFIQILKIDFIGLMGLVFVLYLKFQLEIKGVNKNVVSYQKGLVYCIKRGFVSLLYQCVYCIGINCILLYSVELFIFECIGVSLVNVFFFYVS